MELEPNFINLVRLRIAQLHQSQIGLETHLQHLLAQGESKERLELLRMWNRSPLFSDREKSALAWAEAIALNPTIPYLKCILAQANKYLNKEEIISLTFVALAVSEWCQR